MSSASSSIRSSPYSSNEALNDDDQYQEKQTSRRQTRKTRGGGGEFDDVEQTIHKVKQESGEFNSDYQQFRSTNQGHSKRINEMMSQFDDARMRIDRLLQRSSSPRGADYDYDSKYNPTMHRISIDVGRSTTTGSGSGSGSERGSSGEASPRMTLHKSELVVNPALNKKQVFGAVSLTVKLDDD